MKAKRHKKIRQTFDVFLVNFNFQPPHPILIDGNFIKISLDLNYDYQNKLKTLFGKKMELTTTKCVVNELESLGLQLKSAHLSAMRLKIIPCTHEEDYLPASVCLKSNVGYKNKKKVILATQDSDLHIFYAKTTGLPILHFLNGNILKMRDINQNTKDMIDKWQSNNISVNKGELQQIIEEKRILREEQRDRARNRIKKERNKLCIVRKKEAKKKKRNK